uniref:Gustatory receptor n=1 Tax=Lutzomyia longipalpis TaxID=7200 RepID=A0A3F2ZD84_LUTLO
MILTGDLGILFTFQKLITIPNYDLSEKWRPYIRKLIIVLRCLPFACSAIIVFYQCFSYIRSRRDGFSEISDIAFIVSEFDYTFMKVIMGLIAIYAITHNKSHIKFLNSLENYERNYAVFMIKPRKLMKLWNNTKFSITVLHLIFLNTLNLFMGENYYREDSIIWNFFYTLSITIIDIEGIYVAALAQLIGDFIAKAKRSSNCKEIIMTRSIIMFSRDSIKLLSAFNDAFGIILFFALTVEFVCWSISCFFLIWLLNVKEHVDHKDSFIVGCTTWTIRSFFMITHIALGCDHFTTTIFDFQVNLNTHLTGEYEDMISKFEVHQFQLKKLHQTLLGLNVSLFKFINVNNSILFTIFSSVVAHIVILMQFKQMEEQNNQ